MKNVTDATLTKIEKNKVLKIVTEYGPPLTDFVWTEKEQNEYSNMSYWSYMVSVLTHRPTGYYCTFGAHAVTTCPGLKQKVEEFRHEQDWTKKEFACGRWLVDLKIEVDAPDLWASIGQEKVLSTAASSADLDNLPFTDAERNLIAVKLDEIKGYILEGQEFNSQQTEFVQREFADLKDSSRRFGRKDWLRVLLGVLIGQVINLALTPEKAKGLFALAGTAFQSLWGVVQGYLQ